MLQLRPNCECCDVDLPPEWLDGDGKGDHERERQHSRHLAA